MYALSRPEAVDSAMSSAGAVRTSTGKLTRSRERSTIAFSSRSAVDRGLARHARTPSPRSAPGAGW